MTVQGSMQVLRALGSAPWQHSLPGSSCPFEGGPNWRAREKGGAEEARNGARGIPGVLWARAMGVL